MDIPRNFLKIMICINQKGFITALVKMTTAIMDSVVIRSIRNIEMPHEFLEIRQRRFHQQMKVVVHQDINQNVRLVNLPRTFQKGEEGLAIGIG